MLNMMILNLFSAAARFKFQQVTFEESFHTSIEKKKQFIIGTSISLISMLFQSGKTVELTLKIYVLYLVQISKSLVHDDKVVFIKYFDTNTNFLFQWPYFLVFGVASACLLYV